MSPCAQSVLVNGKPAAHLADFASCEGASGDADVLAEGASLVYVEQLPIAASAHATMHGGAVAGELSPDVFVGGPTFAVPACITIDGPPGFQNKVLRDLWLLSRTPSGQALFAKLEANGRPVVIEPEDDPHNSFAKPDVFGPGVTVSYNPDVAVDGYTRGLDPIPLNPPLVLAHELVHAEHMTSGTELEGKDPEPPYQDREEMRTIGTGSYWGENPSENSFRDDLGQPVRINHNGTKPDHPAPTLRPGKY